MKSIFITASLLLMSLCAVAQQPDTLIIMSYNVENLFHPDNDTLKNDDAFTPDGEYHWTKRRARKKSKRIARAIVSANGWSRPHIVGLCEVEGPAAVDMLLNRSGLHRYYKPLCFPTPDRRGIATAIIYDESMVDLIDARPINVSSAEHKMLTRDILHARMGFAGDTVHVFMNHWPSKFGGATESEWRRNHVAQVLRNVCDSIIDASPDAKIVILGDLNDNTDAHAVKNILCGAADSSERLINLTDDDKRNQSYKYRGIWRSIDHVVVSEALCRTQRPKFTVCALPFLLEDDDRYSGKKPFRTYIGQTFNEGYSDHLPVMVKIPFSAK